MRKLSILFLLMVFSGISLFAQMLEIPLGNNTPKAEVVTSNYKTLTMRFAFDKLTSYTVQNKSGNRFAEINLTDGYYVGNIGEPRLPAIKKLIEVPFGAEARVKVTSFTETEFKLSDYGITNQIMPVQPSLRKDQDPNTVPFEFNKVAYDKNSFTERPVATVEMLGTLRGVRIARLVISPVDYNPVTGEIKIINNIDVEITFSGADVNLTKSMKATTYSPYFDVVYSRLANYNGKDVFDDHPDLTKYPVKYLIISDRMFESTLQPFIQWKIKKGFNVITAYTDVIGATANAIKTYITSQYNAGTQTDPAPTFILFVGDTPQIPPSATGSSSGKATDLYYGSIDGDYFPEMYYGRLSAINVQQLQNQIDKIMYYEKYQFADPTYLNKATLIAGADGTWNPRVGQPTIQYGTNNFFNAAHGFTTVNAYLTSPYTSCYDPAKIAVSLINYTAHCSETSWGDPSLSQSTVNGFTNTNQYPLAIANCCLSADFGYAECMGETWMRSANKGGVAYIGSSPSSYWFEDFYWAVGAFPIVGNNDGYVPTTAQTTLGAYEAPFASSYVCVDALVFVGNLAVTEVDIMNWPQHSTPTYYWQAYNNLGDPSTVIYLTEGETNTVSHMAIVPIGVNFYNVTAMPGSYVAISKDGVLHGAALVGSTGEVQVPLQPILSGGMVDVVVTRPQTIPYMVQIPAAALSGPYIVLDAFTINDITGGNNNQAADYGETIKLNITLKNVGADPGNNITATISGTDPYVTLSGTTTQSFGNILASEGNNTATVNNAFTLVIANNVPDQYKATFVLTISNDTTTWTSNVRLTINAPVLAIGSLTINDGGAGIPSVLDPGETAQVVIEVKNNGHAPLANVNTTLTTINQLLTINTSSPVNIGALAINQTKTATFSVTASAAAPLETPVAMNFTATGGQYNISGEQQIVIGLIPAYNMVGGTVTACIGKFYDSGGPDGDYGNSESLVMTIAPATAGNIIQMTFSSFSTENSYDKLYIYNGNSESAPQIAGSPFMGTNNPGTVLAQNASGALTFKFTSDGSVTRPGWTAQWLCVDVTNPPVCSVNPIPANNATNINPLSPVTWNNVPGAFSYDIYFGTTLPDTPTANLTSNQYSPTMTANTTYVWKVVPKNNAGDATGCSVWTFTTGDMPTVINMSNTNFTTCNGLFYDSGGPNADYASSQDFTMTMTPATAGSFIQVIFTAFELEANATCNYDRLSIYDGPSASAPLIGTYCGTSSPGVVTATNENGKLTFVFHSDGSVTKPGWVATVSCFTQTYSITFNVTNASNSVPLQGATVTLTGQGTQNTNINGSATFSSLNSGSFTYTVTKDGFVASGGSVDITNANVTVDVELEEITYAVNFTITDGTGPVENAKIEIFGNENQLITNASGQASINLPDGNYKYRIMDYQYQPYFGNFQIIDLDQDINVTLTAAQVQTLPFYENFEGEVFPPAGWTVVDFDLDGHSWESYFNSTTSNHAALSASWETIALNPVNLLMTPAINLTGEEGQSIFLKYMVAATGNNYYAEHYKVVVTVPGENENIVFQETLTELESGKNFAMRKIDLSAYAGDSVFITFVHSDCTDQDALLIDNVEVYATDLYQVTFNVDMRQVAEFNPNNDLVYVTGDMNNWMEPGTDINCQLMDNESDSVYTMSFITEPGNVSYEFYINAGWEHGELAGEAHRTATIICDTVIMHVFGSTVNIRNNETSNISVFPNPFNNLVTVINNNGINKITISGMLGSTVIQMNTQGTKKAEINTAALPKGIYFIRIVDDKGNDFKIKMIK